MYPNNESPRGNHHNTITVFFHNYDQWYAGHCWALARLADYCCLDVSLYGVCRLREIPLGREQMVHGYVNNYVRLIKDCLATETKNGKLVITCATTETLENALVALDQVTICKPHLVHDAVCKSRCMMRCMDLGV